jgi:predicted permease
MGQDIRLALRGLIKAPGFTLIAVVTLALGMGGTTMVASIVDPLMLRPRPFGARSDRLVTLHSTHPTQAQDWDGSRISYADLRDIRDESRTLEAIEGFFDRNVSLAGDDESERVLGASVTPGLFSLLGVTPQLGRMFRDDDGALAGAESVVILSDALWRRRFGADPAIVGRGVPINGRVVSVIGVMPPGFRFPEREDLWLPYAARRDENRSQRFLLGLALLRERVDPGQAQAELDGLARRMAGRHPETNRDWGIHLMRIRDFYVTPQTRRALGAVQGAVAFALLVAAINVAGLLVARGIGRRRELTVRLALGAGRYRLVRLLLVESVLLALAGGLAGLMLASWGVDALLASMYEPPPYWVHLSFDGRIVTFVLLLAVVTALVSGLLPALRVSHVDRMQGLSDGGRTAGAGPAQRRLQGALVVAQVALSLALLTGATLLVGSAIRLQYADAGFNPTRLLSLRVYLAGDRYDAPAARAQVLRDIVERARALPGVAAAGFTGTIPADDGGQTVRVVPERGVATPGRELGVQMIPAMPEFWSAMALALVDGRSFTAAEAADAQADVVVVNRRLADAFWPGDSALGRRLGLVDDARTRWFRVVGVAPNLVYEELGEETAQSRLVVYMPYARLGWRTMALLVRASGDPAALAAPVRRVLREVDQAIAPYDVLTMSQRRVATQWGERFIGEMFASFALMALLMAALGAYGVIAYAVGQRTREIGVRLALGAKPGMVAWLFLRRGVALTALGLAFGAPLALATARAVQSLLFNLSPWTGSMWSTLPLALAAAILSASYVPAWRASRTDPVTALRYE